MSASRMLFVLPLAMGLAFSAPAVAQQAGAHPPAGKKDDKGKPAEKPKPPEVQFATEVMVLHATNSGKGIDSRIGDMPELKKPPFSSYDTYVLLSKSRLPLTKDDHTMQLPNGRVLKTKLIEVTPDKDHVRISATINKAKSNKSFLPLLEVKAKVGQAFIVAGQPHKGGILVLVIRVVK